MTRRTQRRMPPGTSVSGSERLAKLWASWAGAVRGAHAGERLLFVSCDRVRRHEAGAGASRRRIGAGPICTPILTRAGIVEHRRNGVLDIARYARSHRASVHAQRRHVAEAQRRPAGRGSWHDRHPARATHAPSSHPCRRCVGDRARDHRTCRDCRRWIEWPCVDTDGAVEIGADACRHLPLVSASTSCGRIGRRFSRPTSCRRRTTSSRCGE